MSILTKYGTVLNHPGSRWFISTTSGPYIDGYILNVYWHDDKRKFADKLWSRKGDGDGKVFKTQKEADTYCLEHGYIRPCQRYHANPYTYERIKREGKDKGYRSRGG
jgi:hypothetical protein